MVAVSEGLMADPFRRVIHSQLPSIASTPRRFPADGISDMPPSSFFAPPNWSWASGQEPLLDRIVFFFGVIGRIASQPLGFLIPRQGQRDWDSIKILKFIPLEWCSIVHGIGF